MILELDCGNSFIKWRVLYKNDAVCSGVVASDEALVAAVLACRELNIRLCRLVSVRSEQETSSLVSRIATTFRVSVTCAKPTKKIAGVTNGYVDYELLGLDRWLAVIGGFKLAKRACLVLDLGTAVTADFVDVHGLHIGGFICPGMALMRDQLRTHTRRIRYDNVSAERALLGGTPGRTTVEAVERGCMLMLQGFVQMQLQLAHEYWGDDFTVFITGGDADLVADIVPDACVVPDLVFVGLAIACPLC